MRDENHAKSNQSDYLLIGATFITLGIHHNIVLLSIGLFYLVLGWLIVKNQ